MNGQPHFIVHNEGDNVGVVVVEDAAAERELTGWIMETDRTITAIARVVGFGPRRRLYEIFCREVGMTPTEYRRQRQLEREFDSSTDRP